MHFDLAAIPQSDAYKPLVSTVVPRPVALVTTVDRAGPVNAAPFSFFNAVSSVPPVVVLEEARLTPLPSVGVRPPRIASRRPASNASASPAGRSAEWEAEEEDKKQ
jgi:hypothetical protein